MVGKVRELRALGAAVGRAEAHGVEPGEDVELGDDEPRQRVDAGRVAQRDEVEPPRAPGAAGVAVDDCLDRAPSRPVCA